MNRDFWAEQRVFLTGHTGFKGSWLTLWLGALGAEVTGYALDPPSEPSLFARARVGKGTGSIHSVHGDIRDLESLAAAMRQAEPTVVLHLAAQSLVKEGYRSPVETYSTNVLGTAHVLEAVRRTPGVRAAVSVTTDKCYRDNDGVRGYREDDPLGGKDPYSSSKAGAELVTSAYRDSFFADGAATAVASARAGNVIGGGDWAADRLIPDLIRGFASGAAVKIRSPHAVRPWQHVLEPLRAYLELAERLAGGPDGHEGHEGHDYAEGWNFGPDEADARPVEWIAERLVGLWGEGAAWHVDADPHPPEADYLRLDVSKAKSRLGWKPAVDLGTALEWIVKWHRAEFGGEDPRALCLAEIAAYEERLASA